MAKIKILQAKYAYSYFNLNNVTWHKMSACCRLKKKLKRKLLDFSFIQIRIFLSADQLCFHVFQYKSLHSPLSLPHSTLEKTPTNLLQRRRKSIVRFGVSPSWDYFGHFECLVATMSGQFCSCLLQEWGWSAWPWEVPSTSTVLRVWNSAHSSLKWISHVRAKEETVELWHRK